MPLDQLPLEILLNILSYLDDLKPLSSSNKGLKSAAADSEARNLRSRLSSLTHRELLIQIWTPPAFFFPGNSKQHRRAPETNDLLSLLGNSELKPLVRNYTTSLEEKSELVKKMTQYLLSNGLAGLANFPESFTQELLIHLWSARERYGHDIDGYLSHLGDSVTFKDLCDGQDRYFSMQSPQVEGMMKVYYALSKKTLEHPFGPRGHDGIGLHKMIVRVSYL